MDAQTANMLLTSGDSGTGRGRLGESCTKAGGFCRDAQETISRSLRTLAAASEGDPATEATVVRLTDDFAHHRELIGRALENDSRPGGKDAAREDCRTATFAAFGRLRIYADQRSGARVGQSQPPRAAAISSASGRSYGCRFAGR
ncbi:hypothetical protein [Streptomyces erythrochromogenes]|uniref:hypothetical protein n=1 Tax=Streptomyces erythrochromogenes TaxID=285574 RepID=UPI00380F4B89